MAKIKKLKENGSTIYPATIPEGVVDTNGFTLAELLDELLEVLAGGSRGNMELAFSDLREAIGSTDGYDLSRFVAKVNAFLEDADASDAAINRWKEIESFLAGITDTKTLTGLLTDTLNSAKSYTDANKYTLPVATASTLGGVKSGEDVEVDSSGIITVHFAEKANEADCDENGDKIVDTYARFDELPVVATASKAGLVKSGGNITVGSDGAVTVNQATKATQDKNGADIAATYLKSAAVTDVTEYAEITI